MVITSRTESFGCTCSKKIERPLISLDDCLDVTSRRVILSDELTLPARMQNKTTKNVIMVNQTYTVPGSYKEYLVVLINFEFNIHAVSKTIDWLEIPSRLSEMIMKIFVEAPLIKYTERTKFIKKFDI